MWIMHFPAIMNETYPFLWRLTIPSGKLTLCTVLANYAEWWMPLNKYAYTLDYKFSRFTTKKNYVIYFLDTSLVIIVVCFCYFLNVIALPPSLICIICGFFRDWKHYATKARLRKRIIILTKRCKHIYTKRMSKRANGQRNITMIEVVLPVACSELLRSSGSNMFAMHVGSL